VGPIGQEVGAKVLAAEFLRGPSISGGRLLLKHFIALGERDPGLLPADPDVPVGRSQDVSSSVPARTRIRPSLAGPAIQEPHSGQTHRVLVRPLSASR
jgi:hypothetical protein